MFEILACLMLCAVYVLFVRLPAARRPRRPIPLKNLPALAQGGASSGAINYPAHMLLVHQDTLAGQAIYDYDTVTHPTTWWSQQEGAVNPNWHYGRGINVFDEMYWASRKKGADPNASPYASVEAYDPDVDLRAIDERLDRYADVVDSLSPATEIAAAQAAALSFVDTNFFGEDKISDAVDAMDNRTKDRFLQMVSRMESGAFDVRAVMSSQFNVALSNMEIARQAEVDDYEKQLRVDRDSKRAELVTSVSAQWLAVLTAKLQESRAATALSSEINKQRIVAKNDQRNQNVAFEEKDALWDLDLFRYSNGVFSSIAGAATMTPGPTKAERMLGMVSTGVGLVATVLPLFL